MKKSNEFSIYLGDKKYYFPGETLQGQIILDLSKSIDVQHITLTFKGLIEGQGEKVVLMNESKVLALPKKAGQKYSVFSGDQIHTFDFEFKIPDNNNLPSSVKIPKVVDISYTLTAVHKKPKLKLSSTLPAAVKKIKVLDLINIEQLDFKNEINTCCDIGFLNNGLLTQWNIKCPKSAFTPGDIIPIDCNMRHFPPMDKAKALKVSLVQVIYKTNNPKIIDKRVIVDSCVDINTTDGSYQCSTVSLKIPPNTPPTIFPLNGRIISVSYFLKAELNMKGVKSTIQFQETYSQESIILIGTYPTSNGLIDWVDDKLEETTEYSSKIMSPHIANFSRLSLDSIAIKPILEEKSFLCSEPGELDLPVLSSKSVDRKVQRRYTDGHKSTPNLPTPDYYRSIPSTSLPDLQQPTSIEIKPLGRLTEEEIITSPYLSPKLKHTDMTLQEDDIISHNSTKASKGSVTFLDSLVQMI
ncbi:hypothetical protein RMATCC62417_16084 [Rhizopus microsporus]|nr:hypothetical protein RMATCC62417_16084 [Rhizopus microsporus]